MAGARKFAFKYIDRNDLVSLTRDASEISGIPYIMDSDRQEIDAILSGNGQAMKRILPARSSVRM